MARKRKKFYAVANGRETGIFTRWEQVYPLVNGFKGSLYKGFMSKDEAEKWLKNPTIKSKAKHMKSKPRRAKKGSHQSMDCEMFSDIYDDLPDGAFFALSEEMGITIDDWAEHADQ